MGSIMDRKEERPAGRGTKLKTAYVDGDTLDARAASWLEAVAPYTRHPFAAERLGPRPALLVIDVQRFFFEESSPGFLPAGPALLPRLKGLIRAFRSRDLPIVFTCHADRTDDASGIMIRWWGHGIHPEDPSSKLHPEMNPGREDLLLVKNHYSAFRETGLEAHLRAVRASSLVLTGAMTHLCCETTAREAFMRGFDVIVVVDGMVTLDETLHRSSLRAMVHGFAVPALSRDVRCGLEP